MLLCTFSKNDPLTFYPALNHRSSAGKSSHQCGKVEEFCHFCFPFSMTMAITNRRSNHGVSQEHQHYTKKNIKKELKKHKQNDEGKKETFQV